MPYSLAGLAFALPFPKLLAQLPQLRTPSRKHTHAAASCSTHSGGTWSWPPAGGGEGALALKHSQVLQCRAAQSEAGAGAPASQFAPQARALKELGERLNSCPVRRFVCRAARCPATAGKGSFGEPAAVGASPHTRVHKQHTRAGSGDGVLTIPLPEVPRGSVGHGSQPRSLEPIRPLC